MLGRRFGSRFGCNGSNGSNGSNGISVHGARQYQIVCPPDKSLTHRAIIFASMAHGTSRIRHPLMGADCISTYEAFKLLGVDIVIEDNFSSDGSDLKPLDASYRSILIHSEGVDSFHSSSEPLDFGNSGTTARLMIGLLSSVKGLRVTIIGDDSLSVRPMHRVVLPLRKCGASITGRADGDFLPIEVHGQTLSPEFAEVSKASAQIKSSLLLAAMQIEGESKVELPGGSRDHTEKLLRRMGADILIHKSDLLETITLRGPFIPPAQDYVIPGDPSSAAFLAVFVAIKPKSKIIIKGMMTNPTRIGFVEALMRMGMKINCSPCLEQTGYMEEAGDYQFEAPARLTALTLSDREIPALIDEIPILAVAAMFAEGKSRFEGLAELRVKESDRLAATKRMIEAAGGCAEVEGEVLIIDGDKTSPCSFEFDPEGDHRLAMASAVIAIKYGNDSIVLNPRCVDVSFPGFFDLLEGMV